MTTLHIPTSRQGQTGMGQGGFTAHEFATAIGEEVTIALKSRIPLDTALDVVHLDDRWHLLDPTDPETVIMEATRWEPDFSTTEPVTFDAAEQARQGFAVSAEDHPAPHCVSCGLDEPTLRVQAGPLGDGRWATPFLAPAWAARDGIVDTSLIWMAMDCSCGWYISGSSDVARSAVTAQFAVQIHQPIKIDTPYALVAWHGDYEPGWDGRKRGAAAALFDTSGACVAQSRSFWIAIQ